MITRRMALNCLETHHSLQCSPFHYFPDGIITIRLYSIFYIMFQILYYYCGNFRTDERRKQEIFGFVENLFFSANCGVEL
jgi:hypothetical protein